MSDTIRELYRGYALLEDPDGRASENCRVFLKKSIYYDKGGYSGLDGKMRSRGYYMALSPVSIEYGPGYRSERSIGFSGSCILLEGADRFSDTKAQQIVSEHINDPLVDRWLAMKGLRYAGGRAVYESMAKKKNGKSCGNGKKEKKGFWSFLRRKK